MQCKPCNCSANSRRAFSFLLRWTRVTVGQTSANNSAFSTAASPPPMTQTSCPAKISRSLVGDSIIPRPENSFSPGIPRLRRLTPVAITTKIDCNTSPLRNSTRFAFKSTLAISTLVQRSKSEASTRSENFSRNSRPFAARSPG
jgi:hypothetical protein